MRWMRWIGLLAMTLGMALAAGVGLAGAMPGTACACSCVQASVREHFDRADAVFTGTIVSRSGESARGQKATLVFDVSAVYKGEVTARQEIVTHPDGATCGLELTGTGPFLMFANAESGEFEPAPADGQYVGSLCGGSRPLDQATRAELRPVAKAIDPIPVQAGPVEPNAERPNAERPNTTATPADGASTAARVAVPLAVAAVVTLGTAIGVTVWRRRRPAGS